MPFQLQLESRSPVAIEGTTATIGSAPACDLVIGLAHIQPEHAQIRRMLGKWLVESGGDWLIQVDDGIPARKGWLTSGATIRLSEQGPLVTFKEESEELSDVIFDEFSGEEISTPAPPPPPAKMPPAAPRKPVARNQPAATPKKTVAQNAPTTPAAQQKTVKKVVKKATPPPAEPPQPKPAGGFDVLAFLMGDDKQPKQPAQPTPQPTGKPGGVRSVPTPPGLADEPPAAGKKPPEKKAPEKSGPTKCDRCNVPLRPTGQCPACGRQY